MKTRTLIPSAALAMTLATAIAQPALAGDPAAGEEAFGQCKTCHSITAPDGTDIVSGGRTGPNLFGVVGGQIAGDPAYLDRYSASMVAAGANGSGWSEGDLAAYIADPSGWLQAVTGDPAAKSRMSFALDSGAEDVAAYLAQFR